MKKYFPLLIIAFLNIYCSRVHNNLSNVKYNISTIDLTGIDQLENSELNISQIVDNLNVKYVKLETTEKSMVEVIFDSEINNSNIFILNKSGLLMFDLNGKFIKKIGTYGKGPNEHLGILGFSCTDSLIAIISNFTRKMLLYNSKGDFLKTFSVNVSAGKPNFINNSCMSINRRFGDIYDNDYYITEIVKTTGDTIAIRYLRNEILKSKRLYVEANSQWYYNDTLYIKESLTDTIYTITNNSITPRFVLDMGKYKLPDDFLYNMKEKEKYGYKYITMVSAFENCNCIYLILNHNNKKKVAEYNKRTKQTKYYYLNGSQVNKYGNVVGGGFKNDIDGSFPVENLRSLKNNKLLTILYPYNMNEKKLNPKIENAVEINEKKKDEFQKLMKIMNIEDNPVLLIYTVR